MIDLNDESISLGCKADSKRAVLAIAAEYLENNHFVTHGFYHALMERELEMSTYVGAGIAIPHCSKKHIALVSKTGHHIFQFPDGVSWGNGKVAFIVIAVAAQKDEHITVLSELGSMLGDELKTALLSQASTKERFIEIFKQRD
ncbi:PTS sugar transporter subunit IIA [Brenneria sp. 4F2]|nr:PTS sugar transporter subunit IIA [Brenneria bubanii]